MRRREVTQEQLFVEEKLHNPCRRLENHLSKLMITLYFQWYVRVCLSVWLAQHLDQDANTQRRLYIQLRDPDWKSSNKFRIYLLL